MKITFFEEFATQQNLEKVTHVNFASVLYVAATSVAEFESISVPSSIKKVYWPVLTQKEGYWISPFTAHAGLLRLFKELQSKKIPVMLDLELPTTRNPWLYITQLFNFFRNKRLIKQFIASYKGELFLAEYGVVGWWMQFLGLHFSSSKVKVIKMWYHSLHPYSEDFYVKQIKKALAQFGDRLIVTVGVIAPGVESKTKLLSAEQLEEDLKLLQELGVKEVIVFRLGGLTAAYREVIGKFV